MPMLSDGADDETDDLEQEDPEEALDHDDADDRSTICDADRDQDDRDQRRRRSAVNFFQPYDSAAPTSGLPPAGGVPNDEGGGGGGGGTSVTRAYLRFECARTLTLRLGRTGCGPIAIGYSGDVYGRCAGLGAVPLRHQHPAPEVADLFAALVEAPRLDGDDRRGRACSATPACRAPWSRRRSCRRGTSASCAGASRPRGWRCTTPLTSGTDMPSTSEYTRLPTTTFLPNCVCVSAYHASVCSGWWFIVIMQNRWSSYSVMVLPGQCL